MTTNQNTAVVLDSLHRNGQSLKGLAPFSDVCDHYTVDEHIDVRQKFEPACQK